MDEEERMILSHESVPRYKTVIHIAMSVTAFYLGTVFLKSLF